MWKLDGKKLKNKAGFWTSTNNRSLLETGTGESIEILELDQTKVNIRNISNETYLEKSDDDNVGSGTSVVEKTIDTKYREKWIRKTSSIPTSPQVEQDPQKWIIETKANEKSFFKLKLESGKSGKYLTATSSGGLTIEGKA